MKRPYLRMFAALMGFAGLAVTAKAQGSDQIVVKIPFEFSVSGKTLPAGPYRVDRLSDRAIEDLVITSVENHAGAVVRSAYFEDASVAKTQVTFETVGDQHFLSKIEAGGRVFAIAVSHPAVLVAAGKSHAGGAAGSASGRK